ncbi:MAG: histone deacetylase [Cyanobacteria bacterium]|nr:histone deacetylase [Cyanobacteriota bacterium]MDA0865151.1 histone deacetylase [Cyanobacteriota bacterium]
MAAAVSVIYSEAFLTHDTGPYHPENGGRLKAVVAALQGSALAPYLTWQAPTALADRDPLSMIAQLHSSHYMEALAQLAQTGGGLLDPDTPISPQSYEVALLAVNGWLDGVDQVVKAGRSAFVLARPPGHHAVRDRGMGFCLFSNAAIAAHYALQEPGIERVAILDWDVHHGNGTQALVENNGVIAYCSLHQSPAYPGTGRADDQGTFGNVLNLPMPRGSTLADYQLQFEQRVLPFLQEFNPDLLIISAGYDATQADPLAGISLQPSDFGVFTEYCLQIQPRLLFGLEGGYDYDALARSVVATLQPCIR